MPPGAPFQPSQRPLEGVPCSRHIRPPRHHVIERHRDVGAENPLDLRGALGGERASTAVHVALELDARSPRSEEHTSELQSPCNLVCRLLLEKKKKET